MSWKTWCCVAVLGLSLPMLAGCGAVVAGAAAGAGAVAYVRGELKATEEGSLDEALNATEGAVADLGLTMTGQEGDALSAKLTARTAEDKRIEINLKKISETLTEIRIRVDIFGDEDLSRIIHNKIKERL